MTYSIRRSHTNATISPNDLGYVELPREAVLDNTASPSERQAFATIASFSALIPAALFAPEVAALAGLAALVGCGDPGEVGAPTLTSFTDTKGAETALDLGTTDEGDTTGVADNGQRRTGDGLRTGDDNAATAADDGVVTDDGDALVTDDDGGMSTPDDGMSLVDGETDAGGATDEVITGEDADVLIAADDGDALVAGDDGDTLAADDDGMSTPDDGMSLVDGETDAGGATDEVITGEDADVLVAADDGDALVAGDDGGISTPDDGETVAEIAPPPQDADAGEDAIKDTAIPCTPSCIPVAETVTCQEGSTNVPAFYFVKCATKFVCNGVGNSAVSVNLPDPTTQTMQQISVDKCVKDLLFGDCQAINGDLSEYCTSMKIAPTPKPNTPPTVNQLIDPADKALGILPGGDQCFKDSNSIGFSFTASDKDNNPLTCGLKIYQNGALIPAATVSATFGNLTKPLMLQLSANLLKPVTDYCWNVSCDDGKGGVAVAGANQCFTTSEKGLIGWWRFDEGQGTIAKDSSGNGVDGALVDFDQGKGWVKTPTGGGLFFDGIKNYVDVNSPLSWNTLDALTAVVSFSNALPLTNELVVLIDKSGSKSNQFILEFLPNKTLYFAACSKSNTCSNWPTSKHIFTDSNWHTVTGMYDGAVSSIYVDGVLEDQITYGQSGGPLITSTHFMVGRWVFGTRFYHGTIDDVRIYNIPTLNTCK